jgi:hypothetical protein
MPLTPEQRKTMEELASQRSKTTNYVPPSQILAQRDAAKQLDERAGFFSRSKDRILERWEGIKETKQAMNEMEVDPISGGVRIIGDVIGGIGDVAGEAAAPAVDPIMERIGETKVGGAAFEAIAQGTEAWEAWKQEEPGNEKIGELLEGLGSIASILPVGKAAQIGAQAGKTGARVGVEAGIEAVKKIPAKQIKRRVEDVAEYATAQVTGLEPDTLKILVDKPETFQAAQLKDLSRASLAEKVTKAFDRRVEDLSGLGSEYDAIRARPDVVDLPEGGYAKFLEDTFNVKVDGNKIERTKASFPMEKQDISAIEDFLSIYGKETSFTPDEFLKTRKALDNIARFDRGKTDASRKVSRKLRQFHDGAGKEQIPGLKELDSKYGPEAELIGKVRKQLFTKDGELKPGAINQIANITGKGKDTRLQRLKKILPEIEEEAKMLKAKDTRLQRLKKILPEIEEEAKMLKAIENVSDAQGKTVGAYARGIIGGAAAATGNVPLIMGALATSPKLVVPILAKYGAKKAVVKEVIEKIKRGIKLNAPEAEVIMEAIEKMASMIGGTAGAAAGIEAMQLPKRAEEFADTNAAL